MANDRWIGAAQLTALTGTFTITGNDVTTTYKVTINSKVVSVLGNAGGVNSTASDLQAALAASQIPEFQEITWTVSSATVTGVAATAGNLYGPPVTSVSGGAGTIGAWTQTIANSSPNDLTNALNWSLGAIPINTNVVFFDNQSTSAWWNLSGLSAVSAAGIFITSTFTGDLGLAEVNTGQGTPYEEYRPRYFVITSTAAVNVGDDAGQGSQLIYLNLQASAVAVNVRSTGNSKVPGIEPCLLLGSALTTVTVSAGSVGCALLGSETSAITTLNIGNFGGGGNAHFRGGAGLTVTTLNMVSGDCQLAVAPTTVTQQGGTLTLRKGNVTTLTVDSGRCVFIGDGTATTITNCTLSNGATLDLSQGTGTITFTNQIAMDVGCQIIDPGARTAAATTFKVNNNNLTSVQLNLGVGRVYTVT